MQISMAAAVERFLPRGLRDRARPHGQAFDVMLARTDDRSVSRRIAIVTFLVRLVSAGILYFTQILLARWMGDFQYGVFVVVWTGAVILGSLACLGIHTAVLRFVPEYLERNQLSLLRGVLIGSRVQGAIAATIFAVIGGLGLYAFGDRLSSYYLVPLYLSAVTLPMLTIAEIQDGLSRSFSWADLSLWPTYIVRPVLILGTMWAAVTLGWVPDAITAMAAVIAATYVTSIGQLIWLERRIRQTVPAGPRSYRPIHWTGIALPIFVVEGFFFLLTNVDVLIVAQLMEPDKVAIYFAAAKTMALVHFIYFAVKAGGAQRFSKYYASGDHARLAAFVRDTLHWTFWPSLAMAAAVAVAGEPLLLLFGENFASGYPLLLILSVGLLVRASIGPAETLLAMAGQQRICALVYTGAFALNVVLNFQLIPVLGLIGAATATTITLIVETICLYFITSRRLGIRCSILTFWRQPPTLIGAASP
jgi:O-antigen/teichoic acid export membrane protein